MEEVWPARRLHRCGLTLWSDHHSPCPLPLTAGNAQGLPHSRNSRDAAAINPTKQTTQNTRNRHLTRKQSWPLEGKPAWLFSDVCFPRSPQYTRSQVVAPQPLWSQLPLLLPPLPRFPGWYQHSHAHSTQACSPTEDGGAEQEDGTPAIGMAVRGSQWLWHSCISRKVRGQSQRLPQPLDGLQGLCRPRVLTSCVKQSSWEGRLCDAQAPASFPACDSAGCLVKGVTTETPQHCPLIALWSEPQSTVTTPLAHFPNLLTSDLPPHRATQ